MTSEPLKYIKELAADIGFSEAYLFAVKRAAPKLFVGGRARQSEIEDWLRNHPKFSMRSAYKMSCNFSRKE